MTRIITYCLVLLITIISVPSGFSAETNIMSFNHHSTGAYTIKCALRDRDGIVWFGTKQGLFTAAQLIGNATEKRPVHPYISYNIRRIQQDGTGRLWITTLANKYILYNPKTGELVKDVEAWLGQQGIKAFYDFGIETDNKGNVWIYKDNNVWILDTRNKTYAKLTLDKGDGTVTGAKETKDGMLLLTSRALYITADTNSPKRLSLLPENIGYQHTEIIRDLKGNIWVATHSRLYEYNHANRQWMIHTVVKPDICDIAMLKDGRITVATTNDGIYCFCNGTISNIRHTAPITDGILSNHLEGLFYDPSCDILTIFYHKHNFSISKMKNNAIAKHHIQWPTRGYLNEDIIALATTHEGHILAGTEDNGVYETDDNHQIIKNMQPLTTATSVICDSKGRIWTGLYRRGLINDRGDMYFEGQSPMKIVATAQGLLFVILNGEGIWTLDTETGKTQHIPTSNPWIMDITTDGTHTFAATPDMLYIIDCKTLEITTIAADKFKSGFFKDGNKAIFADRRGWVWMVNYKCGSDIDIYDSRRKDSFTIPMAKGSIINSITEDHNGNVWLASNHGLMRITITDERKRIVQTALYPDSRTFFNDKVAMAANNGVLLFGTTDGYVSVDTRDINPLPSSSHTPNLILSAMRINSDFMPIDSVGDYDEICALPYLKSITLPYNKNNLWIELAPRDLDNQPAIYYYLVEGMSNSWIPLDQGGITLPNLQPGTYSIKISRDLQQSGEISGEEGERILTVTINPPFYRTIWAYAFYLLLTITLAVLVAMYIKQKRETKKKIEELYIKLNLHKSSSEENTMAPADRQLLDSAIRIMEENISNPDFSVEELSARLCMHRTNLYKRWPAITGLTPLRFMRLIRLKHGKLLLEQGARRISDVAYECGFNDPKKFSKYFKEEFGVSPSDYMK